MLHVAEGFDGVAKDPLRVVLQCRQGFERELAGELKPNESLGMGVVRVLLVAGRDASGDSRLVANENHSARSRFRQERGRRRGRVGMRTAMPRCGS